MLGDLQRNGMRVVREPADADVIIVNTCAFVEEAKSESIAAVIEAAQLKADRKSPARGLFVTGCLAQRYADELAAELPEVDAVVVRRAHGCGPSFAREPTAAVLRPLGPLALCPFPLPAVYSGGTVLVLRPGCILPQSVSPRLPSIEPPPSPATNPEAARSSPAASAQGFEHYAELPEKVRGLRLDWEGGNPESAPNQQPLFSPKSAAPVQPRASPKLGLITISLCGLPRGGQSHIIPCSACLGARLHPIACAWQVLSLLSDGAEARAGEGLGDVLVGEATVPFRQEEDRVRSAAELIWNRSREPELSPKSCDRCRPIAALLIRSSAAPIPPD